MNKLFTKIATFAIGAFMAVGVGIAATLSGSEPIEAHAATGDVVFELGANGEASHHDGSSKTSYSETVDGYTLSITSGKNMYTGARDALGNSCIKFGASSKAGSMSFTTPDNVTSVILAVGKYKTNTTKITVNGTAHTLTKSSNDGAYDDITVDTSSTKTVSFTTVSGGYRAMLNTITFVVGSGDSGDEGIEDGDQSGNAGSTNTIVLVSKTDSQYYNNGYIAGKLSDGIATWSSSVFDAKQEKNSSNTNVALTYDEIRVYAKHSFTIIPSAGYSLTKITLEATSTSYANAVGGSGLENCKKQVSDSTVTLEPTDGSKQVKFTNADQSRFKTISVEYGVASSATLESLTVSGQLSVTTYSTADSWDPAGLTVTGIYSEGEPKDLTNDATFKYYDANDVEKATPKDLGVGENLTLKVTATYGEKTSSLHVASNAIVITKAIEFTLVTDPSTLTKGTQFILVGGSDSKAMLQEPNTDNSVSSVTDVVLTDGYNEGSVATSGLATVFTLDGVLGSWAIKSGDNQLGFTGNDNKGMQFNSNQTDTFNITKSENNALSFGSVSWPGRYLQYNKNTGGTPRFSNYANTSEDIYMFAIIAEVTYGTTNHISISTLPETEFCVGEPFHTTGMALIAYDAADEETANSKIVDTYSTSIAVGTVFAESDIGEKTITVTYVEGSNFTTTYTIYVYASATYQLVTSEPTDGWAGTYIIAGTISGSSDYADGEYAFNSSLTNLDTVGNIRPISPTTEGEITTVVASQHYQVTIAPMADGDGYSIKAMNDKYIGWNTEDKNGLNSYDEPFRNVISYDAEANKTLIRANTGERGLKLDSDAGRFRYYSTPGVNLYKLTYSADVQDYADIFLDTLSTGTDAVCDAINGNTDLALLKDSWGALAELFQELSNTNKEVFTQGTANESGDIVAKTLALYDYIATKYGAQLESEACPNFDFMSRGITQEQSSNRIILANNSQNSISLIVIATVVMSGLIIGYFALRKRKEQ